MRLSRLLALIVITTASVWAQTGGTFETVNYPGADFTVIEGINNNGDVVGLFNVSGFTHGFVRSGGVFAQLDLPGTTNGAIAYSINDLSQVVGGGNSNQFYLYDVSTKTYTVFNYPDPRGFYLTATGINNAGEIVGHVLLGGAWVGFKFVNGTYMRIRIPGAYSTKLTSINNLEQITGLALDSQSAITGSYLIQQGHEARLISIPSQSNAYVVGVNDNDAFVGDYPFGCSFGCFNAGFEWVPPIVTPIRESGNNKYTYAYGINNSNQVVGSYNQALSGQGYIWTPSQ